MSWSLQMSNKLFIAGESSTDRTAAMAAFKQKFEKRHKVADWDSLVDGLDLKVSGYDTKPTFDDFWDLYDDSSGIISPFATQRGYLVLADSASSLKALSDEIGKITDDPSIGSGFEEIKDLMLQVRKQIEQNDEEGYPIAALKSVVEDLLKQAESKNSTFRTKPFKEIFDTYIAKRNFSLNYSDDQYTTEYVIAVKSLGEPKKSSDLTDTEQLAIAAEGRSAGALARTAARGDAAAVKRIAADARSAAEEKQKAAEEEQVQQLSEDVVFYEQCYITSILKELVGQRLLDNQDLPLPYIDSAGNKPICSKGSGFGYINSLAVSKNQKALFGLREKELSAIVPGIKLYKVIPTDEGLDQQVSINFDTNVANDLNSFISRRSDRQGGRGLGVGMRSFDFVFDGISPFGAKRSISAKLVLYATSFSDLLRERFDENGNKFRYIDLALKTGTINPAKVTTKEERENADLINFRIKVVTGWGAGASKETIRTLSEDAKDALYDSSISMYLNAVNHSFDFDDTGAVTFSIDYQAYIENYFGTQEYDIFGSMGIEKQIRMLFLDHFSQLGCTLQTNEQFKAFTEADEKFVLKTRAEALKSIHKKLIDGGKTRIVTITNQQLIQWYENPKAFTLNSDEPPPPASPPTAPAPGASAAAAGAAGAGDAITDPGNASASPDTNSNSQFTYYYLGDILEIVMDNISDSLKDVTFDNSKYVTFIKDQVSENELESVIESVKKSFEKAKNTIITRKLQFEKARILLGPLNLILNNAQADPINCSLGDIPISLNYFTSFLDSKINTRDLSNYPFSMFVHELIMDLLLTFLNSSKCPSSTKYKKVKLNNTVVTAYNVLPPASGSQDDLTTLIINKGMEKNYFDHRKVNSADSYPILAVSGPKNDPRNQLDIKNMINYNIFYAGSAAPEKDYTGIRSVDEARSVFHYTLGEDRGIVKNIVLSRTDAPYLKTTRFEQEGYDGLTQLREVYNASIDTFFNPQTFPGTMIYIEPKGFDPTVAANEDLTKYGIGGYLMVIKSTNSIKPGDGNTQIIAQWVASADGSYEKNKIRTQRSDQGGEAVSKCTVFSAGTTPSPRTTE